MSAFRVEMWWCNFGSFKGVHHWNFTEHAGLRFVAGKNHDEPRMESNGAGKSTLFDALDWGLYGKVPKGDKTGSLTHDGEKRLWVVVRIDSGTNTWVVYRYRGMPEGNGVKLFSGTGVQDMANETALDAKKTDEAILSIVGMSRDVFHAAVYRHQRATVDFAEASDAKRKQLLTRILPELESCDRMHRAAKALAQKTEQEIVRLDGQIDGLTQRVAAQPADDSAREAWEAAHALRVKAAQALSAQAVKAHTDAELLVSALDTIRAELRALREPVPEVAAANAQKATHGRWSESQAALDQRKQAGQAIGTRIQKFQALGVGECATCEQPVTGEHLRSSIAGLELERDQARAAWSQAAEAHRALGLELGQVTEAAAVEAARNTGVLSAFLTARTRLKTQEHHLESIDVPGLQRAAQAASEALAATEVETYTPPTPMGPSLIAEIETAHVERESLDKRLEVLKWWAVAFSNQGVKSYILDSRLMALTEAANEWVTALTGGTFWVRFETQTMTASGLSERLNVRVFRHNPDGTTTERGYKSLSGGEQKRVSLGIDQGLTSLIAARASRPWDLLIIDESFRQHLDSSGREAVFDLLTALPQRAIYVVDHDKEMSAHFEETVTVEIKDRQSHIVGSTQHPPEYSPQSLWSVKIAS